ncbi:MAG TPA: tetratricopeptide repeat protein [Chloroflexia bacterium]|nr:tetratricopeptide repeat protein [Chloroflexia bacterium]
MDILSTYIPMDRRQALAAGAVFSPARDGAVLVADISGFTSLTEALARTLGRQRGAEEMTQQLNRVFTALITQVHSYGGSVVGFAGDAITCWFDGDDGRRATACALAMQQAMGPFARVSIPGGSTIGLAMKAAVATGPVRRFVVGDPAVQLLDVLAGATLEALAAAEHLAGPGEVVLTPQAAATLAGLAQVGAWHTDPRWGTHAVVQSLAAVVAPRPWPALPPERWSAAQVRPWLLPAVYERLTAGYEEFLADLRPAVALFLRFGGIDYDADPQAGTQLDAWIRWVQAVLGRYDGVLIQLTIGDKGSYLYAAFGAPVSHADDVTRAVAAAAELRAPPAALAMITPIQIGISAGRMWAGAYGGAASRTYGVLGDETNLAARLMQAAGPGQVLVSRTARRRTGHQFQWEPQPPLRVKGKAAPLTVFALLDTPAPSALPLLEPAAALPMVGRAAELDRARQALDQVATGAGAVLGITAEAGMGKSRLVAAIVAAARARDWPVYGGAGQAYGTPPPYQIWRPIWRSLFGLDATAPAADQAAALAVALAALDPAWVPRLPLLGPLVDLALPDTPLTAALDSATRKASLEALLVDCLRAWTGHAGAAPLLLVLEDAHWIDPLAADLLAAVVRAMAGWALGLVLAYRPGSATEQPLARLRDLPYVQEIPLTEFTPDEARHLIAAKLAAVSGEAASGSEALVTQVLERAGGNPFYIEELLNYLYDRGLDPAGPLALEQLDLPDSLQSLLLGRIDTLAERQQITLKVASAIGRLFRPSWLRGMYPELGDLDTVLADLDVLDEMDLTPLDQPAPEIAYLFKHLLTQEVTYSSLTYAMRAHLHEQFAAFLERSVGPVASPPLEVLAYHYGRSENEDKQREYFHKAADALAAAFANAGACYYYERLLPLLPAAEQIPVLLALGGVRELIGDWEVAGSHYQAAQALAAAQEDPALQARAVYRHAVIQRRQGAYPAARQALDAARALCMEADSAPWAVRQLGPVLIETAYLHQLQGEYDPARLLYNQTLALGQAHADRPIQASALNGLGSLALAQGEYARARVHYLESRALAADKPALAMVLSNLAGATFMQGETAAAEAYIGESLVLRREIGDRAGITAALNNLGVLAHARQDYARARSYWTESLQIRWELGDKAGAVTTLNNLGVLAEDQAEYASARDYYTRALAISRELGNQSGIAWALANLSNAVYRLGDPAGAWPLLDDALARLRALQDTGRLARVLKDAGLLRYEQGDHAEARACWREGLQLLHSQGAHQNAAVCLIGLAALDREAPDPAAGRRATGLAAAAARMLSTLDTPLPPAEQALQDRTIAALRTQLGDAPFDAAWAEGLDLSWPGAVAAALGPDVH